MLDAHADEALCDGNGVFGDELLEGDEEASLDGNASRDGRAPSLGQYSASVQCMGRRPSTHIREVFPMTI